MSGPQTEQVGFAGDWVLHSRREEKLAAERHTRDSTAEPTYQPASAGV